MKSNSFREWAEQVDYHVPSHSALIRVFMRLIALLWIVLVVIVVVAVAVAVAAAAAAVVVAVVV